MYGRGLDGQRISSKDRRTVAADTMIIDLDNWICELRTYARTASRGNRGIRKATDLMVKNRSDSLTYRSTLTRFGRDPTMTNLLALKASFKELWVLKCIV